MFYVYVLKSLKTGRLYIGHTQDLSRRLSEHNSGHTISTRNKGPYEVAYCETYESKLEAVRRELALKTGKGREELKRILVS